MHYSFAFISSPQGPIYAQRLMTPVALQIAALPVCLFSQEVSEAGDAE